MMYCTIHTPAPVLKGSDTAQQMKKTKKRSSKGTSALRCSLTNPACLLALRCSLQGPGRIGHDRNIKTASLCPPGTPRHEPSLKDGQKKRQTTEYTLEIRHLTWIHCRFILFSTSQSPGSRHQLLSILEPPPLKYLYRNIYCRRNSQLHFPHPS